MRGVYLRFIPFLVLLVFGSLVPQVKAQLGVIPLGATWRYDQSGTLAPANWAQLNFDDSSWAQGPGNFSTATSEAVPAGQTVGTPLVLPSSISYNAYYFRIHFNNTADPGSVSLQFSNLLDDGAIFFLNGEEIRRVVMPAGAYDNTTRATRADDMNGRGFWDNFSVPGSDLLVGDNVLAVELHQGGATSSDAYFGSIMNIVPSFGPTFTQHPQNTNVIQGRNATLTASANGIPTPTYQWFFGGNPIEGATGTSVTISNMTPAQAGQYLLRATGFSGAVDSQTATVTYTADDQPPVPLTAVWTNETTLVLTFDESVMDPSSDAFSYDVLGGPNDITVGSATVVTGAGGGSNVVILTTNPARDVNESYQLFVEFGSDLFGNLIETPITIPIFAPFIVLEYTGGWLYNQLGTDLGTAWKETSYDTAGWASGNGVFAQEPDPSAELAPLLGTDLMAPGEGGPVTVYFRTTFNLPEVTNLVSLIMDYFYDDAFVAYLNGVEVLRLNVPAGHNYLTFGTDHEENGASGPSTIPLSAARTGLNVLAVELHNVNATSSDSVWGARISAIGEGPKGAPVFGTHPQTQTVAEHTRVTFTAQATGAEPITYQWQRNNVNIAGATNSTYVIPSAHPLAHGGTYQVVATNPEDDTTSNPATLTVTPDTIRPAVFAVTGTTNLSEIIIAFSEAVNPTTAQTVGNYVVDLKAGGGNLTITSATVTNGTNVVLVTSPRAGDSSYKIAINNVTDLAETPNAIAASTVVDVFSTVVLLAENAVWRFDERNIDLGTAWVAPAYNDAAFATGPGIFGVDSDAAGRGFIINTPLQLTFPGGTNQTTTYYFRNNFTFGADVSSTELLLRVLYDDGIIVYLNGTETWRSPSLASVNPVTNATFAVNREGDHWDVINIGNTNLVAGNNVIAVELHQTSAASTDVLFGLIVEALVKNQVSRPHLKIDRIAGGQIQVTWTPVAGYILVESATANGTYTPVAGNPQGTYTSAPTGTSRYFQLRNP